MHLKGHDSLPTKKKKKQFLVTVQFLNHPTLELVPSRQTIRIPFKCKETANNAVRLREQSLVKEQIPYHASKLHTVLFSCGPSKSL